MTSERLLDDMPASMEANMPQAVSLQDAQYAFDLVEKICTEVGPGLPGTPQERQRGEMIQHELQTYLGRDHVAVEEFSMAPEAFLSTLPGAVCMLAAVILNLTIPHVSGTPAFVISIAAVVLSAFVPLSFILEFFLSYEVFDLFFPKKVSTNVIGTLRKEGSGEIKHLLIVSGHHDSALENTWLRYTGMGFYILSMIFFIGMLTLLVACLIQLIGLMMSNAAVVHTGTLSWILVIFPLLPAIVFVAFLTRGRKNGGIVPGAADNLSACAVAVSTCRFLVKNPGYIPEDTEIRFITFGSEEAGLRGSRRYVKRHMDELKRLDVRLLNYEILAYPVISILSSDVNGTVKNSPEMVESVIAAAQRAGVPYKLQGAAIGVGGASAPFSRAGLKALTLQAFKTPEQQFAFYHQDRDTPEVLTLEPLLSVLKLTIEWIKENGK
jgi:hypothetical protein